jgi:hypothetical protein
MKITVSQLREIIREVLVGGADPRMSGGRVEDELTSKKDPQITALQSDIRFLKSQINKVKSGKLKGQDVQLIQKALEDKEKELKKLIPSGG